MVVFLSSLHGCKTKNMDQPNYETIELDYSMILSDCVGENEFVKIFILVLYIFQHENSSRKYTKQ